MFRISDSGKITRKFKLEWEFNKIKSIRLWYWQFIINKKYTLDYRFQVNLKFQLFTQKSDLILLPRVGAFKPAMLSIKEKGLNNLIYEMVNDNVPIIGICLGMQLLGRSSIENEYTKGLNLITEDVYKLEDDSCHIGWNSAKLIKKDNVLDIPDNQDFYFNHSYAFSSNLEYTVCETTYKSEKFSSIIRKDKVAGYIRKESICGIKITKKINSRTLYACLRRG